LAVIAALFLFAGCGDDEGTEGESRGAVAVETGSLSKAEFVKRADELCGETKAKAVRDFKVFIESNPTSGSGDSRPEMGAKVVETILAPGYRKLIDEIAGLGAPADFERDLTKFLSTLQSDLESVEDRPQKALNSFRSPFERAAKTAEQLRLPGCARTLK
jgi:hypothetical protein